MGTYCYLAYLGKFLWAGAIGGAFYPHPENSLSWAGRWIVAIALIGISAVIREIRERRYLLGGMDLVFGDAVSNVATSNRAGKEWLTGISIFR